MIPIRVHFLLVLHLLTLKSFAKSNNTYRDVPEFVAYAGISKPQYFDVSQLRQKFPKTEVSFDFLTVFENHLQNPAICLKNQCCHDLIGAFRSDNDNGTALFRNIKVHSGRKTVPGVPYGNLVSHGTFTACKALRDPIKMNYVSLSGGLIGEIFPQWMLCLPGSCTIDNLNEILDLIKKKIPEENQLKKLLSTFYFKTNHDADLYWDFTTEQIIAYSIIAAWTIFILFSPFSSLNINTILHKLTQIKLKPVNKSSSSQLYTLDGFRVLSLFWVISGHSLSITALITSNYIELPNRLVTDTKWFLGLLYATPSVDSFFVIGGLLTGYLTKRNFDKSKKFRIVELGYAILNRTFRLMPPIIILVVLSVTLLSYQSSNVSLSNQPFIHRRLEGSLGSPGSLAFWAKERKNKGSPLWNKN